VLAEKEARDAARGAARATHRHEAETWVTELSSLALSFPVKAGAQGEVFGSVTAKDVAAALAARGYRGITVKLPKPRKELGEHRVELDLGEGIKTTVAVTVVPEGS
jgi:large subunit ribosomal protein L9